MSNNAMEKSSSLTLPAFSGYGIELEYMIVDRVELSPLPIADQLLRSETEKPLNDVDRGLTGWSNELACHVMEVKNRNPSMELDTVRCAFQNEVRYINHLLRFYGAMLMPTAMHPWMDPSRETHLWPHDNAELYAAYGRVFNCNTHGWGNLQSMHVNLPFSNQEEFVRLHAAVRLILPLLPALAASSPIADGNFTGYADFRMQAYSHNADEIPSISGLVVPETVYSCEQYQERILNAMYRDIASRDPKGILQHEWLNSRGAIARFDRNAIEIRVIDIQECPLADLSIAAFVIANIRMIYKAGSNLLAEQQAIETKCLADILKTCIRHADKAIIEDKNYLRLLGLPDERYTAAQLWQSLLSDIQQSPYRLDQVWLEPLQQILAHGPLARRILHALDGNCSLFHLKLVYRQLCECLQTGHLFLP
jgi:gamma-glutamyl:cysteine ligase YbdK (ATP-grasp superfamily)